MSPPLEAGHGPFWGMGMKSEEFISNCMQASSWNAMRLEFENKGRRVAYYAKDKKVFWASSGLDGLSPVWKLVMARPTAKEIGRESCSERVCQYVCISVVAVSLQKKINILTILEII